MLTCDWLIMSTTLFVFRLNNGRSAQQLVSALILRPVAGSNFWLINSLCPLQSLSAAGEFPEGRKFIGSPATY